MPEIKFAVVRDGPHDISTASRRIKLESRTTDGMPQGAYQSEGSAGFDVVALQLRNDSFIAVVTNSKEVLPTSRCVEIISTPSCLGLLARAAEGLHETRLLELLYLHHATWQIGSCRSLGVPVGIVESQRRGPAGATLHVVANIRATSTPRNLFPRYLRLAITLVGMRGLCSSLTVTCHKGWPSW